LEAIENNPDIELTEEVQAELDSLEQPEPSYEEQEEAKTMLSFEIDDADWEEIDIGN
jgi:hypothetical protein